MRTLWLLVILLLIGCNEAGLMGLDTQLKKENILIRTADAGVVIPNDGYIPISVVNQSSEAVISGVDLSLYSSAGKLLYTRKILPEELAKSSAQPLKWPDLAKRGLSAQDQFYTLKIDVNSASGLLKTQSVPFFVSDRQWNSLLVASHPQEIYPGSTAILEASFETPPPPTAYIRWKQGPLVLQEGLIGSGAAMLKWKSPLTEGLYTLSAEVFPQSPPAGQTFAFKSSNELSIKLVVTTLESYEPTELSPDQNYLTLYHFRGNLRDSGVYRHGKVAEKLLQFPEPDLYKGFFGYDFSGKSGVETSQFLLPITQGGDLQPFSLNSRFLLRENSNDGALFYFYEISGFSAELKIDTAKGFEFVMISGDKMVSTSFAKVLELGKVNLLTLSVVPQGEKIQILWYWNGILENQTILPSPLSDKLTAQGVSRIAGGNNGFPGILDEAGVYFQDAQKRPNIDDESFLRAMTEKYGADLEFAQGFDGLFLPATVTASGLVELKQGRLIINPGASITLPQLYPSAPGWKVTLTSPEKAGILSLYYVNSDVPLLTLDLAGRYTYGGGSREFIHKNSNLDLELTFGVRDILCRFADQELALTPIKADAGLKWVLSQKTEAQAPFQINDFLILKDFTEKSTLKVIEKP